jgi:uncharacterized membrane protein
MDLIFIEGVAAVVCGFIVFVGSVWLLLAVIMGARLAYFVTASVCIGFIFIMTLVWSYGTPLGPVGQMPEWHGVDLQESASELKFGPASEYPDSGGWEAPAAEDQEALTKAAELESAAIDYLAEQIKEKKGGDFLAEADATPVEDSARLLTQGEKQYGALQLEASSSAVTKAEEADPDQAVTSPDATLVVVMEYDPGNPLKKARTIALGTFVVFALHLFGLSRAERKTKEETTNGEGAR